MHEEMRVAVVGATGMVGQELCRLLEVRGFPVGGDPVLVASQRSAGRRLPWKDHDVAVRPLAPEVFEDVDLAFFSAGADRSRQFAPVAAEAGAVVIDNSPAWRMDPEVPLVVSEVNPQAVSQRPKGIIANPNCTTMTLMVAVKPLHEAFGLVEMVVASYQAVSGAGRSGIAELVEQTETLIAEVDVLRHRGRQAEATVVVDNFSRAIAFNVLPHCGDFQADRYTVEEHKLVAESRKILDLADLRVSPTNVRVPVVVGHCLAARLTFEREVSRERATAALDGAPGVAVVDGIARDGEDLAYPTPLSAAGRDEVLVGRMRRDLADPRSLNLFVSGDNVRKGAALNAVQIAELITTQRH